MSIADQVRILRKQKGITQYVLARTIGTSQKAITRFENAEVKPNVLTLERLAEALDCDLDIKFMPRELKIDGCVHKDVENSTKEMLNKQENCKRIDSIKSDIHDIKKEILEKIRSLYT